MDAIGSHGQRNVSAGINQEASLRFTSYILTGCQFTSYQFPVLSTQWRVVTDCRQGFLCQDLKFTGTQIGLAELDVIDTGMRGFRNFGEQHAATGRSVSVKLAAVGNVIQQTAVSHHTSDYYFEDACVARTLLPAKPCTTPNQEL